MSHFNGSLDTNVVLRLLLNDIPEQHIAAKKLLGQATSQFVVADTVIIELVFVLERYYGFSRMQIAEAVSGFMKLKDVNCNRSLFEKALSIFTDHLGLSFEDCCLSTCARINDADPLWTFDKKLANQVSNAKLISA